VSDSETLLGLYTITQRSPGGAGSMAIPAEAIEALGGSDSRVACVLEEGKVYYVPVTEVSLL